MEGNANQKKVIRSSSGEGSRKDVLEVKACLSLCLSPLFPLNRNFLGKYESNLSEIGEMFIKLKPITLLTLVFEPFLVKSHEYFKFMKPKLYTITNNKHGK